ncbi:hypothetical protein Tco_1210335 [Tanacetum coccineum]
MLLTRLFKYVVSVSPKIAFDHYLLHNRAMHLLAPHYERKTRANRGKKTPCESNASSPSSTLNHPSLSHPLDDSIDEKVMNLFIPILLLRLKTSLPHQMMSLESIKTLLMKELVDTSGNLKSDYSRSGEVDVVFDGAFGGVGDEEVIVGEGVVVTSYSLDMLTNSCQEWIIDEDDDRVERDAYFIREEKIKVGKCIRLVLDSKVVSKSREV